MVLGLAQTEESPVAARENSANVRFRHHSRAADYSSAFEVVDSDDLGSESLGWDSGSVGWESHWESDDSERLDLGWESDDWELRDSGSATGDLVLLDSDSEMGDSV